MNPEDVVAIIAVVEDDQPDPEMGRAEYLRTVYGSFNESFFAGLQDADVPDMRTAYSVCPKGGFENFFSDLVSQDWNDNYSFCIQPIDVTIPDEVAANSVTLVTGFRTPAGQDPKIFVSEVPLQ